MDSIILVGGNGNKIWPYSVIRNKCMIPISNEPILKHAVDNLLRNGIENVYIIGSNFMNEIKHYFRKNHSVKVIITNQTRGSAETLQYIENKVSNKFIVLFGDCLIDNEDISNLINNDVNSALVSNNIDDSRNWICCELYDDFISKFWGHPRGNSFNYIACGFTFDTTIFEYLKTNQCKLQNTKVGVGSPSEMYLESSINDMIDDGINFKAVHCNNKAFDIDKPWHILEANDYYNAKITSLITHNIIGTNSTIDNSCVINGHIKIGDNSTIGKDVIIEGNIIVGNDTVISNGAIIQTGVIIGDNCSVKNNCKVGSYSTIGNDCIIDQTADFLGGIIMRKSYLYHYGEYYGLIGENTDLGAGTTCGTLRFDDGDTSHYVKGRKETPKNHSNACFIGDYSRTGVGAIILPGCKIGCRSVVGSGVILNEDLEDNTLVYAKQELIKKTWGDNKYGW